jgi:Chromo (CHRromatin Organisation MOdifier) domain
LGQLKIYPQKILSRYAIKQNNVVVPQLLIRWTNLPPEDASWEDYDTLANQYPTFILEDKNNFEQGECQMREMEFISIAKCTQIKEEKKANEPIDQRSNLNFGHTVRRQQTYRKQPIIEHLTERSLLTQLPS